MKRREFIAASAGAVVARPLVVRAQSRSVRRLGVLWPYPANDETDSKRFHIFVDALHRLGWIEGRTLKLDFRRSVGQEASLGSAAKELVALSPDVIVASTTPAAIALHRETRTIPIVFVIGIDPVGQKLVASLGHPGGNVTGFPNYDPAMSGKLLELLREVAPRIEHVAVMFNPDAAPYAGLLMEPLTSVARTLSLRVTPAPVHDVSAIDSAIAALGGDNANGLFVMPDRFTGIHRNTIVAAAAHFRVPAVYAYPYFAAIGGLIAYGVDIADLYRRAAGYVDRILKGVKPAELPVQNPTKFELSINLRTAKALGLNVPPSLLARADQVIE